jgi:large subunit ribosomal protein L29
MPKKKTLELKEFTIEDLKSELSETEEMYQKLSFDHATKGLEKPIQIREVRRDIARIKTEIRRREMDEWSESELAGRSKKRRRRSKR